MHYAEITGKANAESTRNDISTHGCMDDHDNIPG